MLFSMHEFPEFHSFDHQFNFDRNFQHCKNKSGQKIVANTRAVKKKGILPSIWSEFHAVLYWPKLECVRRLALLSAFWQLAI